MLELPILFFWVLLGFVALAFLETTVEGGEGGGEGTYGWRKEFLGYRVKEYHFWLWYVVVPIFVFSPLALVGFDLEVVGVLAMAYLVGGVVEDFAYFIVNPHYGLGKWNSSGARWMPWFRVGRVEVPKFYVRNLLGAGVIWLLMYFYL